MTQDRKPLLEVKNLSQHFKVGKNIVKAVNDVSFKIYPGETYGLVGESGSGKSTTGRALIRLYDPTEGEIIFDGRDLSGKLSGEDEKFLRMNMQMIFQDPMASLNPRQRVLDIVASGLDNFGLYKDEKEREEKVLKVLTDVGLSPEHASRFPHQFSGGQRQRIGIARALILNPKLLIADEAISALDVSIQAQVVTLLGEIQKRTNVAILFIAHDLSMVKYISDRIGVIHLGHLVETGTSDEIFGTPLHPYTKSLLSVVPTPNPIVEKNKKSFHYDYHTSGLNYEDSKMINVGGKHEVRAKEEELEMWIKNKY
ncbi:MAG: ATP-binding cassette domain-containing protein [Tissierellia bacterium]|nr:ATP-binding cassette domain-containing protein [Tissierellia bacterium]